ncbi:Cloroperoxidase, partial [Mollisia scopiformis]
FDAQDQLVSVTGEYVWQSPAVSDIRGPCPGLNAAANHGYLPRNGIATIEQTAAGLEALYNMNPVLGAALAAYAVATDGNVVEGVWSIGGPLPSDPLLGSLLGDGQGISYSHNAYEGDASIGRNDAYLNNGDAHSLNITKFEQVYAVGGAEDRYTLDKFRARFETVQDESIANNPYYFTGAFSTVVVVPAAYNFVINFMSNHTAQEPSGCLDGYNFKSFFGVTGQPGSFVWQRGQERVPDQWYRRPTSNQYTAQDVFLDVGIGYAAYPNTLKFGGNTGTPNSFVGLNVANLSGGVYDAQDLFQGDNLACFSFSVLQEGIPDFLSNTLNSMSAVTSLINQYFGPIVGGLNCPQIQGQSTGLFNQFPGYKYSPIGPATNY